MMELRYAAFVRRASYALAMGLALFALPANAQAQAVALAKAQIQVQTPAPVQAQTEAPPTEPVSIVLLAHPGLTDPNFARTVVLVTRTPGNDTIGVILNRRLPADALALPEELTGRDVYFGGPLAPRGLLGIGPQPARNAEDRPERDGEIGPSGVVAVLPGLQLVVGSRRVRALAAAQAPERVKLFSGYAGWAPQQLESEIARGGWAVQEATEAVVFDPDPGTLWERLTARARAVRAPVPPRLTALAWCACIRCGQSSALQSRALRCPEAP